MVRSLERELKEALDDLATIRKAKSPSEKRNICYMLRAALVSCWTVSKSNPPTSRAVAIPIFRCVSLVLVGGPSSAKDAQSKR